MLIERIKDLVSLDGVSSREDMVIDVMYESFLKISSHVSVDTLGNVICRFPAKEENAPRMMIFAHMDEIGFIVRKIEESGFIRIERVGGVSTQILPGTWLKILGRETVRGVIGTPSHHFIKVEDKFSVPSVDRLYVDIGASDRQEVLERGIDVGTMAVFDNTVQEQPGGLIYSKAIDDRAGCAILLELADYLRENPVDWEIYLVAAVMEEYNIRGILPAVHHIQPDVSIGIDVTPACDTPDMDYNEIALGKGLAITEMNFHGRGTLAGVLPDRKLLERLKEICVDQGISYQKEVSPGVITENAYIMLEQEGVAVANLSVPTRYTHTPFECINIKDAEGVVYLLQKFMKGTGRQDKFGRERGTW